jgi:hypothetical protein
MAAKDKATPKGAIVHLIKRAMGGDAPYLLTLSNEEEVVGPITHVEVDKQLKASRSKNHSTLVVRTAKGREVWVNDITDVTLLDGSPLPHIPPRSDKYWL